LFDILDGKRVQEGEVDQVRLSLHHKSLPEDGMWEWMIHLTAICGLLLLWDQVVVCLVSFRMWVSS